MSLLSAPRQPWWVDTSWGFGPGSCVAIPAEKGLLFDLFDGKQFVECDSGSLMGVKPEGLLPCQLSSQTDTHFEARLIADLGSEDCLLPADCTHFIAMAKFCNLERCLRDLIFLRQLDLIDRWVFKAGLDSMGMLVLQKRAPCVREERRIDWSVYREVDWRLQEIYARTVAAVDAVEALSQEEHPVVIEHRERVLEWLERFGRRVEVGLQVRPDCGLRFLHWVLGEQSVVRQLYELSRRIQMPADVKVSRLWRLMREQLRERGSEEIDDYIPVVRLAPAQEGKRECVGPVHLRVSVMRKERSAAPLGLELYVGGGLSIAGEKLLSRLSGCDASCCQRANANCEWKESGWLAVNELATTYLETLAKIAAVMTSDDTPLRLAVRESVFASLEKEGVLWQEALEKGRVGMGLLVNGRRKLCGLSTLAQVHGNGDLMKDVLAKVARVIERINELLADSKVRVAGGGAVAL